MAALEMWAAILSETAEVSRGLEWKKDQIQWDEYIVGAISGSAGLAHKMLRGPRCSTSKGDPWAQGAQGAHSTS